MNEEATFNSLECKVNRMLLLNSRDELIILGKK